ncbi:MAG: hypothetical protein CW338_08205, partial [Clostridiales bacterium]|nr:hypothetical protein [Clostridiales bacterium]
MPSSCRPRGPRSPAFHHRRLRYQRRHPHHPRHHRQRERHPRGRHPQGYHPHPVLSFASPLGLGLESEGEYLDMEVNSISSPEDMRDKLNEQMTEGIYIYAVTVLAEDAQNSMAAFAGADYRV